MTATILQFPSLRASNGAPLTRAQPLGASGSQRAAGALSPAQELYMDGYLERGIDGCAEQLTKAQTEEAQRYWFKALQRLCRLRSARQIERMEREKGLR